MPTDAFSDVLLEVGSMAHMLADAHTCCSIANVAETENLLQHFWPSVARGSWLMEVNGASHNTFLRASWVVDKLLDLLCKRGPTSHEVGSTSQSQKNC